MSLRDALRKAAGLLVELPPESPTDPESGESVDQLFDQMNRMTQEREGQTEVKTVGQIAEDSAGPSLDQVQIPGTVSPVITPDGQVNLASVYAQANLPTAPFPAERMLEMIASFPPNLPLETQRQTVKVSLDSMGKALGATPETIVADASRKLAALTAYVETLTKQTQEFTSATEAEIAELGRQIQAKRKEIEEAHQKQEQVNQACTQESHRLDDVLEFFSLDVPPSKHAGKTATPEITPGDGK
jgi:molybdopterin converting factor small subunit